MWVYWIFVAAALFFMLSLNKKSDLIARKKLEDRYYFILCLILVSIAALRGALDGTDTAKYIIDYKNLKAFSSFRSVWESAVSGGGYFILSKLFSLTGLSVHWWFGTIEAFYLYALSRLINKYSKDRLYSLVCFFATGLFWFSLAGSKQILAMGFTLLVYVSFADRKYLRAIIFVVCGAMCHKSSLMVVPIILFYSIRNKQFYYPVLLLAALIVFLSPAAIWEFFISVVEDEHYRMYLAADNRLSSSALLFYGFLYICSFLCFSKYTRENKEESRLMYGMSLFAVAFQYMSMYFSTAFRIGYNFLPFMLILLPNISWYDKSKKLMKPFLLAVMLFFFFYTQRSNVYVFFWE